MEARHTRGPWRIEPQGIGAHGHWVHDDDGEYVAMACSRGDRTEEDANARLIAAAPDLLEALQEFSRNYDGFQDGDGNDCPTLLKARTAISRALSGDTE